MGDIFGVEHLTNRPIDPRSRVIVGTIQRLYSKLSGGTAEVSEEEEDAGMGHEEGVSVELPEIRSFRPTFSTSSSSKNAIAPFTATGRRCSRTSRRRAFSA